MTHTSRVALILAVLLLAALVGQQPAEAQQKPSSEVLLPYFEVDLQGTSGVTTTFAVGNSLKQPVDVSMTIYTNWGIPMSSVTIKLAPNQVRSFDLRSWLTGNLPGRKLNKTEQQHFKAALAGQASPKDKLYYATAVGPNLAVGYVRIKTLGSPAPDALWGDYFLLDGSRTFGEGDTLVNLDADTGCLGVCDHHALRFLTGGTFDGGTHVVIWTGTAGKPSKTPAGTTFVQADTLAYDEAGEEIGGNRLRLLPLQVVSVADLGLLTPNGWLDFQTETDSAIAVHYSSKARFGIALQSYCLPEILIPGPGLRLRKLTNGSDANLPPGPSIPVGAPVLWEYIVENTGGVTISDIVVEDDQGVDVTCPKDELAAGESMTCTGSGTAEACQYVNLGTATGKTPEGKELTAEDPSHYFGGPNASLDIEKLVNGQDADTAPGIEVAPGSAVTWTYIVTNGGDVALNNVKVKDDDKSLAVSCPKASLRPGESMTCTASGTARTGLYKNVGTATAATSCGNEVGDSDPAHYTGKPDKPGLRIVKKTNGQHYDAFPGAQVAAGSPLVWTYEVTNTGQVALSNVKVTDDKGVAVSCPKTSLQPDETMVCTGTGTAGVCKYSNVGTATAKTPGGATLSDSDSSFYSLPTPHPALLVESFTNGQDADDAPGPQIPVGGPVQWTYVVTNSGDVTLRNVKVADNRVANVSCPKSSLLPGESMTCNASGTAVGGPFANVGTATGAADSPCGGNASASDPGHYTGVDEPPGIQIVKKTNGHRYTAPPGPHVPVGSTVTWTYEVKNTGKVVLSNVQVTDDKGVAVSCPKTTLQPNESMTCTGSGKAEPCQYSNTGTVTGTAPDGKTVSHSDGSFYFGDTRPAIAIEKRTNGQDADNAPGPQIQVGDPVQWTYVVTNTGDVALADVRVADDREPNVSCPKTRLLPGESMTCTASGTAVEGQYRNVGTATGMADTPCCGTVSASDASHYKGLQEPGIKIVKKTNGQRYTSAPGARLAVGSAVTWTYEVTNIGKAVLNNVYVTDDRGVVVSCPKTTLQPGETMTCTGSGKAVPCQYSNTGIATGKAPDGSTVTDRDLSFYYGETHPAIRIEKRTNGQHVAAAPGPELTVGSPVQWTYVVTNSGDVALKNIKVTDDRVANVSCPKSSLQPGESMTCSASGTAVQGQYKNVGTATGTADTSCGGTATDSDASYYYGKQGGSQGCTPGYWKNHTDSWAAAGYSPSQKVKNVFAQAAGYPDLGNATLHQALSFDGGSSIEGAAGNLLRAAVASLLDASHPGVDYPRSPASVVSDVNAALVTRNRETILSLASALDRDNNLGCPLN